MKCPACDTRFDDGSSFCALDGARLIPDGGDPDLLLGSVLADRYRLVRLLGEGGMGRVYEAEHVDINKRLAIKVLRAESLDPAALARFRQEARSASLIGHENIVAIEDFAALPDGKVYLAMELLDGESLGDRMRRPPPLGLGEAAALMAHVCRGLAAAHDKGVVHRDMKPENIFLAQKSGRVVPKILDFGIAKVSSDEGAPHLTRTGAIFGTPLYMSPEQAKGLRLDHRADIYSTGVILYELATGRVPFKADSTIQILNQHISEAPERPTRVAPERRIPAALEATILRAMAKEPAERQASMAELADELERVAGQHTRPATVSVLPATVTAASRRGRRTAAGIAGLVLLLGVVVTVALRAPKTPTVASPPRVPAAPAPAPPDDHKPTVQPEKERAQPARKPVPRSEPARRPAPAPSVSREPRPAPAPPSHPADPLSASVERLAASEAPGARRVGPFYPGQATEEGQHIDEFVVLESGRCYDVVAVAGPGVRALYLYLWGPNGRRATDRREGRPNAILHYCATIAGQYHFQVKVADGRGDYRTGLYAR
jgi:serine/threonine-protein kinase